MAKILLIEDMAGVRVSLAMILSRAGHNVLTAEDGQEGLDLSMRESFDLIVTDILMPRMDGSEVIFAFKERNDTTPVLAISGGGATVSAEQALKFAETTADAVLIKPFSKTDVLNAVNKLTGSAA